MVWMSRDKPYSPQKEFQRDSTRAPRAITWSTIVRLLLDWMEGFKYPSQSNKKNKKTHTVWQVSHTYKLQSPTIGKENDINTRLKRTNNQRKSRLLSPIKFHQTLYKKVEQYKDHIAKIEQYKRLNRSLTPINSTKTTYIDKRTKQGSNQRHSRSLTPIN